MASSAGLRSGRTRAINPPSPVHNTISHLVVCGVTDDINNVYLFGDFLGFTSALREQDPPVNGTFLNCFNLDKYFNETDFPDVKFGRTCFEVPTNEEKRDCTDEIAIYTRFDYTHQTRWWEQLTAVEFAAVVDRVLEWIEKQVSILNTGDVITVILIENAFTRGGVQLGGKILDPSQLASVCSRAPFGAQINIIVKACCSDRIKKVFKVMNQRDVYAHTLPADDEHSSSDTRSLSGRNRNSLFGAAYMGILGLTRGPSEQWKLQKQTAKTSLMVGILSRDYVDMTFSSQTVRARRLMTPPDFLLSGTTQRPTRLSK